MAGKSLINCALAAGVLLLTANDSSADPAPPGIASIYNGGLTANGETAETTDLTAAHRTLPFHTRVRVTNKKNGRSVVVRINDRGPFIDGRVIDLTPAGANALGFDGLTPVTLYIVDDKKRPPVEQATAGDNSDDTPSAGFRPADVDYLGGAPTGAVTLATSPGAIDGGDPADLIGSIDKATPTESVGGIEPIGALVSFGATEPDE
jgi:rare lipoprotein A